MALPIEGSALGERITAGFVVLALQSRHLATGPI